LSITHIRKSLLLFERAVNKNQDQRSKYPDDPSKSVLFKNSYFIFANPVVPRFIDSEADLDTAIKSLLPLSQSPSLAYSELVRSGMLTSLVGLLTHENMDIVIDVVELIYELTDEDADMEYEDENYEVAEEPLKILVEGLVSYSDWLETSIKTGCRSKILPLNYWLIIYHV
jgi:beta-catenin-like protein 1